MANGIESENGATGERSEKIVCLVRLVRRSGKGVTRGIAGRAGKVRLVYLANLVWGAGKA